MGLDEVSSRHAAARTSRSSCIRSITSRLRRAKALKPEESRPSLSTPVESGSPPSNRGWDASLMRRARSRWCAGASQAHRITHAFSRTGLCLWSARRCTACLQTCGSPTRAALWHGSMVREVYVGRVGTQRDLQPGSGGLAPRREFDDLHVVANDRNVGSVVAAHRRRRDCRLKRRASRCRGAS